MLTGNSPRCGKTFTFLPPFSPPYGLYSFVARSQALQRYFLEGRCGEDAAPTVKDPDRVADPSTLRRWFSNLRFFSAAVFRSAPDDAGHKRLVGQD
jgi:hypothetical protein